jgi:hypothetical protein
MAGVRLRRFVWAIVFESLFIRPGFAENPVCSQAMTPAQCAEAQISKISDIFARYKTDVAQLQDQLAIAKAEISALQDKVARLDRLTSTIDGETKPLRPGGAACVLTHENEPVSGWVVRGTFGLIQFRPVDGGRTDAFRRGAQAVGTDWWWEHGWIACAK